MTGARGLPLPHVRECHQHGPSSIMDHPRHLYKSNLVQSSHSTVPPLQPPSVAATAMSVPRLRSSVNWGSTSSVVRCKSSDSEDIDDEDDTEITRIELDHDPDRSVDANGYRTLPDAVRNPFIVELLGHSQFFTRCTQEAPRNTLASVGRAVFACDVLHRQPVIMMEVDPCHLHLL